MKALLLSAYDAVSHRRWREGLVQAFADWDWTVLHLPPRHFRWRIRGNSLSWGLSRKDLLGAPYDLVVATSMTDLSALRGFVPALGTRPTLVYFHENQFAYPDGYGSQRCLEPKIVTLYGALAADRLGFNSAYNRDTFLAGAGALLGKMPDEVPPRIVEGLRERSCLLPVPLEDVWFEKRPTEAPRGRPLTLVWNHRWEYDKGPDRLLLALRYLVESGLEFRIHLLGQRFRGSPSEFEEMRELLGERLGQWGPVADVEGYRKVLRGSDVVVSTALHEFQGLAVLEAVAAGCIPLVPDRLAYRGFVPREYRYASFPEDPEREAKGLAQGILNLAREARNGGLLPAPDVSYLSWGRQREGWEQVLRGMYP